MPRHSRLVAKVQRGAVAAPKRQGPSYPALLLTQISGCRPVRRDRYLERALFGTTVDVDGKPPFYYGTTSSSRAKSSSHKLLILNHHRVLTTHTGPRGACNASSCCSSFHRPGNPQGADWGALGLWMK